MNVDVNLIADGGGGDVVWRNGITGISCNVCEIDKVLGYRFTCTKQSFS
jgi:hypothetical protein